MKNLHVLLMVSLLTCAGGVAIAQDYDAGLKAAQAGDFQTALKEWKMLADQGHAGAQYFLGLMYASGRGVPEDDAEAARWYRLAADQGHAGAQHNLGGCTPTARVYCRTMSLLTCGLISRARMATKMGATTAKSSKGK